MDYDKIFNRNSVLSDDMKRKAEIQLTETPERRSESLQELRVLFDIGLESNCPRKQQIGEYFGGRSDNFLLPFLRVKKYDVERAYNLLDNYLKFREKHPSLTSDLTLTSVRSTLERGYPLVLPTRDKQGSVVFLFSVGTWKPREVPFDEIMRAYIYLLSILLENVENQVSGFVVVENFRHYTIGQAMSLRPTDLQKMSDMLQGAFPIRFKGVHFLYQPWYFTWTYALIRPFLKPKMIQRVHVHGWNLEKFYEAIDPSCLPPDFGGCGEEYSPLDMIKFIENSDL